METGPVAESSTEARVPARLGDLAARYLDRRRSDVREIAAGLAAGDFARIASIGHQMRGTGAGYGFILVSEVGEAIERAANARDGAAVLAGSDRLQAYLARVRVTIAPDAPGPPAGPPLPGRIALVEDNEDSRALARELIGDSTNLVAYASGREALRGMRRERPDLALVDISLPEMNGVELLRRMRDDPVLSDVPAIALTAHAMIGDRERYLDFGFDGYLSKPVTEASRLLDEIRRVLSGKRSRKRMRGVGVPPPAEGAVDDLARAYGQALAAYLSEGGVDGGMAAAHSLGDAAASAGVGGARLARLHERALASALLKVLPAASWAPEGIRAASFLAEALAALEERSGERPEVAPQPAPPLAAGDEVSIARRAAEEAQRAKSRFLANMSHELRTPLHSINGFSHLLLQNHDGRFTPKEIDFLERIHRNGLHLLGLVSTILDLSKIEAGWMSIDLSLVSVGEVVRTTVEELTGEAAHKGLPLVAEVPGGLRPVEMDAGKLKRVLINLIGNAIKFTHRGGVTVAVLRDDEGARPVCIEVRDTGVGIPPERLGTVFEAFLHPSSSTPVAGSGAGLGLAISAAIMCDLGGRIRVESAVGRGSTFRVELPQRRERGAGPCS